MKGRKVRGRKINKFAKEWRERERYRKLYKERERERERDREREKAFIIQLCQLLFACLLSSKFLSK